MTIVRIPAVLPERLAQNEVLANLHVISKLKERGIPVTGSVSITGVARGRLSIEIDPSNKDRVYTWQAPSEDDEL